ncbi:LacI family DNA-binding transcriptional regulator [Streptomyces nanshensis]|uniref:LacI family transcriptional regulator n=1 Tax=Streptomyces nanshensis TaxID=518642 RepID=A0A1E7KWH8_9ACTN|nr:LacI family DNA-binding transcriptional regulator [Streptomyces nanshensis]OEV08276.1 LacI family transcriptional regulator [Streptomyces nanshensis]
MPDRRAANGGKPTLRDVAERAGVSSMTASRVLRGDPRTTSATRERVRAAADELGYMPNHLARSLRLGKGTGLVGLLVTNLANPFYSQLALGVDSQLAPHGLKTVIANTKQDLAGERDLVADLVARRVDGIVAVPASTDQRHLAAAAAGGVPVVLASRPPEGFEADCVLVDDFGGARRATQDLLAQGHRTIGFVGSPTTVYTGTQRLRGFTDALDAAGLPVDERYVRQGQKTTGEATVAARELLALPDPPTALFCSNNRNTIGAYHAIRAAGRSTALTGFDDFELADALGLPLTVVAYDTDQLGRQSAELLISRIRPADQPSSGEPRPPRTITVPTSLITYNPGGKHGI